MSSCACFWVGSGALGRLSARAPHRPTTSCTQIFAQGRSVDKVPTMDIYTMALTLAPRRPVVLEHPVYEDDGLPDLATVRDEHIDVVVLGAGDEQVEVEIDEAPIDISVFAVKLFLVTLIAGEQRRTTAFLLYGSNRADVLRVLLSVLSSIDIIDIQTAEELPRMPHRSDPSSN